MHMHLLSTPEGGSVHSTDKRFPRYGPISKYSVIGHEIRILKKGTKVAHGRLHMTLVSQNRYKLEELGWSFSFCSVSRIHLSEVQ